MGTFGRACFKCRRRGAATCMCCRAVTIKLEEKVGAVAPTSAPNTLVAALEKDIVTLDYSDPANPRRKVLATTSADHGLPHEGFRCPPLQHRELSRARCPDDCDPLCTGTPLELCSAGSLTNRGERGCRRFNDAKASPAGILIAGRCLLFRRRAPCFTTTSQSSKFHGA